MPSAEKEKKVSELKRMFSNTDSLIVLHFKGLRVEEANELRTSLSSLGAEIHVMKNTLARLALKQAKMENVIPLIEGPVAVIFSRDKLQEIAKLTRDFTRGRKELFFRGGLFEGRLLDAEGVEKLASLPSREVLLSSAIGALRSPISKVALVCSSPLRNMILLVKAYAEKRPGSQDTGSETKNDHGEQEGKTEVAEVVMENEKKENEVTGGEVRESSDEKDEANEASTNSENA